MNGNETFEVDLYAEKGQEKRIYEFKLVGKKQYQKGQVKRFKELAEIIDAKSFVVYVNLPTQKEIIFNDLDGIIYDYFTNENFPAELDELSTHTTIDIIEVDEITSIDVNKTLIRIEGYSTISVILQYGSDRDFNRGYGVRHCEKFPLTFEIELDLDYSIKKIEYEIDKSDWYSD